MDAQTLAANRALILESEPRYLALLDPKTSSNSDRFQTDVWSVLNAWHRKAPKERTWLSGIEIGIERGLWQAIVQTEDKADGPPFPIMRAKGVYSLKLGFSSVHAVVRAKALAQAYHLINSGWIEELATVGRSGWEILESLTLIKFLTENKAIIDKKLFIVAALQLEIWINDKTLVKIISRHRTGHAQVQAMRLLALVAENERHPRHGEAVKEVGSLVTNGILPRIINSASGHAQMQAMRLLALVAENDSYLQQGEAVKKVGDLVTDGILSKIIRDSANGMARMQAMRLLERAAKNDGQAGYDQARQQIIDLNNNGILQRIVDSTRNPDLSKKARELIALATRLRSGSGPSGAKNHKTDCLWSEI
jgi:hypothetical protein